MKNYKYYLVLLLVTLAFSFYSCDSSEVVSEKSDVLTSESLSFESNKKHSNDFSFSNSTDYANHTAVIASTHIILAKGGGERTEWFRKDVGNGQIEANYVYGDPRRARINGGYAGITFGVKEGNQSSDVNLTEQFLWMRKSITTWDDLICADLILSENDIDDTSVGAVQKQYETGIVNLEYSEADLVQAGFFTPSEFSLFEDYQNALGASIGLVWVDENGVPTDIDNNGELDVAVIENFYNDSYEWADNGVEGLQPNGTRIFDFPTVAIHEAGHGFLLDHFGVVVGLEDGRRVTKPNSIMNAYYSRLLREPTGRDTGLLCSKWAKWPIK